MVKKHFYVEDYDNKVLSNLEKYIIEKDGSIYFAILSGEIVGTCVLIQSHIGEYELTKMAVTSKAQGKQARKKTWNENHREGQRNETRYDIYGIQ